MLRTSLASAVVLALVFTTTSAWAGKAEKEAIALYKKGVEFGNQGKLEDAMQSFQSAIKKAPKFDLAYLKLGLTYELSDRWPEALACYDAAVDIEMGKKKKKRKGDAHGFIGNLYRKMGLIDMAITAHKKAIEIKTAVKKPSAKAHYQLALDYVEKKLLSDAVRELRAALKIDPGHKKSTLMLANTLVVQEQYEEAKTIYDGMLAKKADDTSAMYGIGVILKKQGKKDEAKAQFKKACKLGHSKACRDAKTKYRALR